MATLRWFAKGYTKTGIYLAGPFEAKDEKAAKRKAKAELLKLAPVSRKFHSIHVYEAKWGWL